jgi:hypothetical protein
MTTQASFSIHDMLVRPEVKIRGSERNFWITLETPWQDPAACQFDITLYFNSQDDQRAFMQHVCEAFLIALESRPIPTPSTELNDANPY